ncbi:hypothetical protein E5N72_04235 [Pseudoalteromonas sp. MEBiC 03607]|uniref:hypothetical protein n=1 Tax=unclassified Pseudoalteromonas TaxID=194690 RepID=UPI001093A2C3|nr:MULTISPECIES: hypothetical protein [unclassified Pseudoalteromonas]MCF2901349.1 hypothetical protein [Pseudoalteromonas sp. OFAV1]TGV19321.1 hypothetical protein E5N72_04235 [Pseudoalteromonas sp. MEBiC 03607]
MTAIGGYNQITLPSLNTCFQPNVCEFQSARAALYAYLEAKKIEMLYLPDYICDSIFPAIESLKIEIKFYSVSELLLPKQQFLNIDDVRSRVILVNYFGLLTKPIKEFVNQNPRLFIVDNSQALFAEHIEGTVSIYSPRKFVGIPDGGYLLASCDIPMPNERFDSSPYLSHLLLRASGDVSKGYEKFLSAERALDSFYPKRISQISSYILASTNKEKIIHSRKSNYEYFQRKFDEANKLNLPLNDQVPLCYPLKLDFPVNEICEALIKKSIFLPRYWPSKYNGEVGMGMFDKTLFLPIDERLNYKKIEFLSNEISKVVGIL